MAKQKRAQSTPKPTTKKSADSKSSAGKSAIAALAKRATTAKKAAKKVATTKKSTSTASAKKTTAKATVKKVVAAKPIAKPAPAKTKATKDAEMMEFIGSFPMRKNNNDKKIDNKKASIGPVFETGSYVVSSFNTPLCDTYLHEFKSVYQGRHSQDTVKYKQEKFPDIGVDPTPLIENVFSKILNKDLDMLVLNMKDIPLELPKGLTLAAAFKREDPRDVLITRATYGAIQELPHRCKIAANSKRRVMQIRALRPDLQVMPSLGNVYERLKLIDNMEVDALVVSWSSLRRLNISPRYYVSLQADLMVPAPCQGSVGIVCREDDEALLAKLRYVEDSEASWSSRCERAFLSKMGGKTGAPIGALAHRKGTQDPWILDIAVGDAASGEVLKHREIGTSRCKPESLADKAFAGVLGKGGRRFANL